LRFAFSKEGFVMDSLDRGSAQSMGWTVLEEFIRCDEGKSGTALEGRYGLQELIALAKTQPRPFEFIIADSTDRFGRNLGNVSNCHQSVSTRSTRRMRSATSAYPRRPVAYLVMEKAA
jgi:DNA invertase Pin-like site-specific DNA recombinase